MLPVLLFGDLSMSILHSVGRALGSSAAYAVHGTHLASTSIAQGAKSGYVDTSERLRERRAELLTSAAPVQRKLAAAPKAKAVA
jgi:hypothetical protein